MTPRPPTPKKVALKLGADDETKRTNEIGTVIPLLDQLDNIAGKTLTADALLTQRALATYLLERNAHYLFPVKNNQPTLRLDIALQFVTEAKHTPDFEETPTLAHGRIEQRAIWTTTALNDYADFPGVGQVFMLRRTRQNKKSGKTSVVRHVIPSRVSRIISDRRRPDFSHWSHFVGEPMRRRLRSRPPPTAIAVIAMITALG